MFAIIIIIAAAAAAAAAVVVVVRQPFRNNSDPAIYVQQNPLGLFVTGLFN